MINTIDLPKLIYYPLHQIPKRLMNDRGKGHILLFRKMRKNRDPSGHCILALTPYPYSCPGFPSSTRDTFLLSRLRLRIRSQVNLVVGGSL